MIDFNLTLVVQLALFLLFLWGTNALAIRPILKAMDGRAEKIAGDRQAAAEEKRAADELQARWQRDLLEAKRALNDDYRKARRAEQEAHAQALAERRRQADGDLAALRAELDETIARERQAYDRLVPDVAQAMDRIACKGARS